MVQRQYVFLLRLLLRTQLLQMLREHADLKFQIGKSMLRRCQLRLLRLFQL